MGYLEKLEKNNKEGWISYCGLCKSYISQSDPQNFSGGKSVVIEEECPDCIQKREEEVKEAQKIMGRLGISETKPLQQRKEGNHDAAHQGKPKG